MSGTSTHAGTYLWPTVTDYIPTAPNPYTVEILRIYPKLVERTQVEGGGEHTVNALQTWFIFEKSPSQA